MANAWIVARYRLLATLHGMTRTRTMAIMMIVMLLFMGGMLFLMSDFVFLTWPDKVHAGEFQKQDVVNRVSVMLFFFLILTLFGGLRGAGIGASPADRDYIFTAPVKPRQYFISLQIVSLVSTAMFVLPIVLGCAYFLLASRGLPAWRLVPLVVVLLVLLSLLNVVGACATMLLSVVSQRTVKWLKTLFYAFIGIGVIAFVLVLIPSFAESIGATSGLQSFIYALPTSFAAELTVYTFTTAGFGELAHGGLVSFGGFFGWYLPLLFLSLVLSNLYYYEVVKTTTGTTRSPTAARRGPTWRLAPLGKSCRRVLLEKELTFLWRTRAILAPLRYWFIFLIPLLYNVLPSSVMGQMGEVSFFDFVLYSVIIFTLLGISGIVRDRFVRERGMLWIQKSLPLKSEQTVDAIMRSTAIVGVAYATIICLALSWHFGLGTIFYLILVLATALIAVSTGVYSNVMSPAAPDIAFSPNLMLVSFISMGLCLPCFIVIGVQISLDSTVVTMIASILVLIYAVVIMRFFRRRAANKLDSYEVTF